MIPAKGWARIQTGAMQCHANPHGCWRQSASVSRDAAADAAAAVGINDPNPVVVPSKFQAAGTTAAYGAASAAGSFTVVTGLAASGSAAADTGSAISVTTDANGRLSGLTIAVTTGGANFTQPYTGTQLQSLGGALTLAQLASVIETVLNAPGTATGAVFQGANQGLSYSAFGGWISNDGGGAFRIGNLAAGNETLPASVPVVGTANYAGSTTGVGGTGSSYFAFTGNAAVSANFVTGAVTTTFSGLATQDLQTNALGVLPTQTGTGIITGNKYLTNIAGGGMVGTANGTFYGPTAQETAGVWRSTNGVTTVIGSFGAH